MEKRSGDKILGVVLCGGESKRMGQDKGLLIQNGERWAEIMYDLLSETVGEVVLSVNHQQRKKYASLFPGKN